MSAIVDDEKWRNFFNVYKKLPEIWQMKSDAYKNREKRNNGWEKLLNAYRQIDGNATLDQLKNRVNNIRTCYRRELRKVKYSETYGSCADDLYVPSLWYFGILDFIREEETAISTAREHDLDEDMDSDNEMDRFEPKQHKLNQKSIRIKKAPGHHSTERQSAKRNKDDAAIYADSWACSYRKLSNKQKLYAKKVIEEILILGQLNALTLGTIETKTINITTSAENTKPEFGEYIEHDSSYNSGEADMGENPMM